MKKRPETAHLLTKIIRGMCKGFSILTRAVALLTYLRTSPVESSKKANGPPRLSICHLLGLLLIPTSGHTEKQVPLDQRASVFATRGHCIKGKQC